MADLDEQLLVVPGLGEIIGGAQLQRLHRGFHRPVRRDHEDGRFAVAQAEFLKHLHAGYVGHHQVEQHHVVAARFEALQAFGAVLGEIDRVAFAGEQRSRLSRISGSSSMTRTRPLPWDGGGLRCGHGELLTSWRQLTGLRRLRPALAAARSMVETRAAGRPVGNFNGTVMLLNDTVGHRKAQARALARALGGEERIVDAVQMLGRDAAIRYRPHPRARAYLRARCALPARRRPAWRRARSGTGSGRPAAACRRCRE